MSTNDLVAEGAALCATLDKIASGPPTGLDVGAAPNLARFIRAVLAHPNHGEPVVCLGCGSTWSDERITRERAARPRLLSCCPERKMVPVREHFDACGARIARLEASVRECIEAEEARRKNLKPGAPATTYTEARLARLRAALGDAEPTGPDHSAARDAVARAARVAAGPWTVPTMSAEINERPVKDKHGNTVFVAEADVHDLIGRIVKAIEGVAP